jgi:hypothetical protein
MKMKNKVALALTLALGSMAAQAQDKGMDISLPTARAPAAPTVAPAANPPVATTPQVASSANAAASNQKAFAPAKPAASPAMPVAVAKPTAVKVPARVEPQRPVEPAQLAAPAPAPRAAQSTPVAAQPAQPTPAAPAAQPAAPASQMTGDTNPFTGKDMTVEARQAQIESAKLDTELMLERLKQANLLADLTYLPLKKKAEVSTMPGVMAAASTSPKQTTVAEGTPGATQAAAPRKAVKKSSKKAAPKPAPAETPVVRAPEPPKVSLTGVSINGNKASAILEVEGAGVFSAMDGDITPYGRVRVVDAHSVILGERRIAIRDAMISRMYVSDPVAVDEKIKNNMVITAPPAAQQNSANIPLPPLPPLPKAVIPKGPAPMPSR